MPKSINQICLRTLTLMVSLALLSTMLACRGLAQKALIASLKPDSAFDARVVPPPPDYRQDQSWAALPSRKDNADMLPDSLQDHQAQAEVDCFYVHGTTFAEDSGWNQALDNDDVNKTTDRYVLPGQAAIFNGSCRVYAPRYRQATLYSFVDASGSGKQAAAVAYTDIQRAFHAFLEKAGPQRPFVLAGHSQGSYHLIRLLKQEIAGTELASRLVVAYLPGWSVSDDDLQDMPGIAVCATPTQVGCLVSWNSEGPAPRNRPLALTSGRSICVNPLSWRADDRHVAAQLNLGGLLVEVEDEQVHLLGPQSQVTDAQCRNGALLVSPTDERYRGTLAIELLVGQDVFHTFDYAYFYMNVRDNVGTRVATYLASTASSAPTSQSSTTL